MLKGIFNPYVKPKENFHSPTDGDNPLDTESPTRPDPRITIDSGAYSLKLDLDELDQIPDSIGNIVKVLQSTNAAHLMRHGIRLFPLGETYQLDIEETILKTPQGHVCVYIGNMNNTQGEDVNDKAFRRLGQMLHALNKPTLLKTHGIEVIQRG